MRSHQNSDSNRPTKPTAIRIQPTTSMSTAAPGSWLTANARIAPTAMRTRLTGRPTALLWPPRVEQKLGGDARVVPARVPVSRRILLQRPYLEARAGDRGYRLAEAPALLAE